MRHQIAQMHASSIVWHRLAIEMFLLVFVAVIVIVDPVSAAKRLQDRSIYMNSTEAGASTFYRVSFRYMSPDPVGSVELLFCYDPIPYNPCVVPEGLDVAGASLSQQESDTGFTLASASTNRLVLQRTPEAPSGDRASYTFDGVINPSNSGEAFSVRLRTFASTDATGPQVDFGSMRAQVTEPIRIETQVPPMLIFCLAQEVQYDCVGTNDVYYTDMGELSPTSTLTAQSQMAVGTNASGGFVITANGAPMSAGTNTIASLGRPTESLQGENQFGINLVANTAPAVGVDPEGEWANAVAADDYGQSDKYMFQSGDAVAYSPNVSLMKKFTVSYIVNSSPNLKAGVYTTTINFIASGRF